MIAESAFIGEWNGRQCCNFDFCECVALVNQWCIETGRPLPQGATAATLVFPEGWKLLPISQAIPGDVVIWESNLPNSDGDGHTAVFVQHNTDGGFRSFDQKWTSQFPALVDHNTDYVRGVYRYEPQPVPQPIPTTEDDDRMIIHDEIGPGETVSFPGMFNGTLPDGRSHTTFFNLSTDSAFGGADCEVDLFTNEPSGNFQRGTVTVKPSQHLPAISTGSSGGWEITGDFDLVVKNNGTQKVAITIKRENF